MWNQAKIGGWERREMVEEREELTLKLPPAHFPFCRYAIYVTHDHDRDNSRIARYLLLTRVTCDRRRLSRRINLAP